MPETATKVQCPSCHALLRTRADAPAAQRLKCPRCKHTFVASEAPSANPRTVAIIPAPARDATQRDLRAPQEKDNTLLVPGQEPDADGTLNEPPARVGKPVDQGETVQLDASTMCDEEDDATMRPRSPRTAPVPAADEDDIEDAVLDERPVRKKKPRKTEDDPSSNGKVIAAAAVTLLLLGGLFAGLVVFNGEKNKDDEPVPQPPGPVGQLSPGPRVPVPPPPPTRRLLPPAPEKPVPGINVGNLAPEISGEDLNGFAFSLSDYRGKVVLLDFWGDWCPWCRKCYPHEKELVVKFSGKPFTMLGINVDESKVKARQAVQRDQLNWASWFDGKNGPIVRQWSVRSYPFLALVDHNGVIRRKITGYSENNLKQLHDEVEELVRDAEAGR